MMQARFHGGPYDGQALTFAGHLPSYVLLTDPPPGVNWAAPLVVGADFDDHWPGQQRYELTAIGAAATYRHVDTTVD